MSELSAGQWQAKRTLAQKSFYVINTATDSPRAFSFRGGQDGSFNLQLQTYYTGSIPPPFGWGSGGPSLVPVKGLKVAIGVLPIPEAPLAVSESVALLPDATLVDVAQEPSYSQVIPAFYSEFLAAPTGYGFSGQDLVWGDYRSNNVGAVPLYALAASSTAPPASVELLAGMLNPRIVIPPQEPVFDAADPFFVADPSRTYFGFRQNSRRLQGQVISHCPAHDEAITMRAMRLA
jgi:hypothetical protein